MAQDRQQRRPAGFERIRRLFVADDEELAPLTLIARLELETCLYAGGGAQA